MNDDTSRSFAVGAFISAMNTVIEPTVNVTPYCSINSSATSGSSR